MSHTPDRATPNSSQKTLSHEPVDPLSGHPTLVLQAGGNLPAVSDRGQEAAATHQPPAVPTPNSPLRRVVAIAAGVLVVVFTMRVSCSGHFDFSFGAETTQTPTSRSVGKP
jgi:hypothetical protein